MIDHVLITEVGLRDGLQNEKVFVETQDKVSVVKSLINAGCCDVEVTAYVHKKRVPQMRDAEELVESLSKFVEWLSKVGPGLSTFVFVCRFLGPE